MPPEIRQLIRDMSLANPLWGAPRIHGELLKLGIDVEQTSVAKYMASRRRPPSQGWTTFVRNHADGIAAMDLFVVPTISFRLLYGLLILRHDRRRILWLGATAHPTAEWIAHQLTEACGWESPPALMPPMPWAITTAGCGPSPSGRYSQASSSSPEAVGICTVVRGGAALSFVMVGPSLLSTRPLLAADQA